MTFAASDNKGQIIIQVLVLATVAAALLGAQVGWALMNVKAGQQAVSREQAIQISESGIDYYRWHLAHAPTDFLDGTATSGPYLHDFEDKDGNVIGRFSLDIDAPPAGSTLVGITSKGETFGALASSRSVYAQMAKPSMAKYAVVSNDEMRFGAGTEVFGPIHSNYGIRFDGLAHNLITSSAADYDDPDHSGANEFGVHTHDAPTDPLPPAAVPARTDVFEVGRQFPVPAVDFSGITGDLADLKSQAVSSGYYRPSAGAQGYHVVLRTDDTFDLYRVSNLANPPSGCNNSQSQDDWGSWSIQNQHFIANVPNPSNGIIFLEDDVFIDGRIDGARLTIVAAFLPDNPPFRKDIIINNDLTYTNYDGTDVIGLIAQGNISVGLVSEDNLRVDGALIAQYGRVGRFYYRAPSGFSSRCSPYHTRQTLTLWGMIGTNERYGFAYADGNGYQTRNLNYDGSLLYGPPPDFPLTSDEYVTLTWREVFE
jgi:hypothetical protein